VGDPNSGTLGLLDPNELVDVWINGNAGSLVTGEYVATVTFTNTATEVSRKRDIMLTVTALDYFTELFDSEDNDLDNQTLTFTRNCQGNFYDVCREVATEFPVDPTGGTVLSLTDDDYEQVSLSEGVISFYGEGFDSLFVGSNGYVTFGNGDTQYVESLDNHFMFPRISALFDDLSPNSGGQVSWKELADRAAVTFENVPEYQENNPNNFQIEMFFGGSIRITYLGVSATDGLAGLSQGADTPGDFEESDLSGYDECPPLPLGGDFEPDGDVDLADFAAFALHWLEINCCVCGGADLTCDGNVWLDDLLAFAKNWLAITHYDECPSLPLGGDFEPDGDVDLADFAAFASHWPDTDCGACGGADLTCDGNVWLDDLLAFAKNWLAITQ
jgi:hypothetical protein